MKKHQRTPLLPGLRNPAFGRLKKGDGWFVQSSRPSQGSRPSVLPGRVAMGTEPFACPDRSARGIEPSAYPGLVVRGIKPSVYPGHLRMGIEPSVYPGLVAMGIEPSVRPGLVAMGLEPSVYRGCVKRHVCSADRACVRPSRCWKQRPGPGPASRPSSSRFLCTWLTFHTFLKVK